MKYYQHKVEGRVQRSSEKVKPVKKEPTLQVPFNFGRAGCLTHRVRAATINPSRFASGLHQLEFKPQEMKVARKHRRRSNSVQPFESARVLMAATDLMAVQSDTGGEMSMQDRIKNYAHKFKKFSKKPVTEPLSHEFRTSKRQFIRRIENPKQAKENKENVQPAFAPNLPLRDTKQRLIAISPVLMTKKRFIQREILGSVSRNLNGQQ